VTDTLPAGVSFTAAEGDDGCAGTTSDQEGVLHQSRDPGGRSSGPSIRLDVVVDSDQTQTISNTAGVTGTTPDPVPATTRQPTRSR